MIVYFPLADFPNENSITLYFERFCGNRVNLLPQVDGISDMKLPANYPDNCALPVPIHKLFL